jgi:hypothetical protein
MWGFWRFFFWFPRLQGADFGGRKGSDGPARLPAVTPRCLAPPRSASGVFGQFGGQVKASSVEKRSLAAFQFFLQEPVQQEGQGGDKDMGLDALAGS